MQIEDAYDMNISHIIQMGDPVADGALGTNARKHESTDLFTLLDDSLIHAIVGPSCRASVVFANLRRTCKRMSELIEPVLWEIHDEQEYLDYMLAAISTGDISLVRKLTGYLGRYWVIQAKPPVDRTIPFTKVNNAIYKHELVVLEAAAAHGYNMADAIIRRIPIDKDGLSNIDTASPYMEALYRGIFRIEDYSLFLDAMQKLSYNGEDDFNICEEFEKWAAIEQDARIVLRVMDWLKKGGLIRYITLALIMYGPDLVSRVWKHNQSCEWRKEDLNSLLQHLSDYDWDRYIGAVYCESALDFMLDLDKPNHDRTKLFFNRLNVAHMRDYTLKAYQARNMRVRTDRYVVRDIIKGIHEGRFDSTIIDKIRALTNKEYLASFEEDIAYNMCMLDD